MTSMPPVDNYVPKKNMRKTVKGTFIARTNKGLVRTNNEDVASVVVNARNDVLLIVADGMGGYNRGDYAAKVAVDTVVKLFKDTSFFLTASSVTHFLRRAVIKANKIIYTESQKDEASKDMGTTIVAAIIHRNKLTVLNIGDSRAYRFINEKLEQLSEDHSYIAYLLRTEQITPEEAKTDPRRHAVINALGNIPSCNMDIKKYPYNGEKILLCSDGLYNALEPIDIETILKLNDNTEQKANMLISLANHRGGEDNVAVALWEASND